MRAFRYGIAFSLLILIGACAAQPPRWRAQALSVMDQATASHDDQLLPTEYKSAREALLRGEELLMEGEKDDAEGLYQLAFQKGEVLRQNAARERARLAQEAKRQEEEKRLAEEKRKAQEEAARLAKEKAQAPPPKPPAENGHKKVKPRERLVSSYTVKSGETLPFIAAHAEVYSDRNLWPLLYRANRDQISDPRHIWPGQVLRVPRVGSREEAEARRFAQEKPLH